VFEDEIKPEAAKIIDYFQKRKIELKIISGDHPETVRSIAQALNVKNSGRTITGYDMEHLSPDEFEEAVLHHTIFARVSPNQKLEIVRALQRDNRYVAMVGDGVNDALAIKEANLGISMGSGSRVTKDVSEIVLVYDTFEIIPGILDQGRIIIQNVRDMAKLFLVKNSFSIILIFVSQFLDLFFPFNPQQITLFNFITITIPSTYIILFAKKGSEMERNYLKEILKYSVTSGFIIAVVALGIGLFSMLYLRAGESLYQTYIVSTICIMGIFNFIYIYTWPAKAGDLLDLKANLTGAISLALLPVAMYAFDFVNDFFVLKKLGAMEWLTVMIFAAIGMLGTYLVCRFDLVSRLYMTSEKPAG
jgi:cation-transporting ATPase E